MYLASEEDLDTTACFLLFHEIRESLRKKQKPVIDLHVSRQVPQSEFKKPFSVGEEVAEKTKPCQGAPLRYLTTLRAACM